MSTFRYDTKFRGATTNKGAIKLAPKFVNCPTCGFVRSKDRSKVIAKKNKQYHLFMPPNAGNEGTYYYIAYDGKPEEKFENSTGFDITCSSIESYSVKFDRPYGSDNFIIYIDNGTAPKSVNNTTDFGVVAFGTSKLVAGNIPINLQNIEITFEDGDSISFNVYSEENFRPGKYNISLPPNVYPYEVYIEIVADNKIYSTNGNWGYSIYFDTIQSIKYTYNEDRPLPVSFLLNNDTKVKSAEPSEFVQVLEDPTFGQIVATMFEGSKDITVTFEDDDVLTIPVINESIPKIYKYELTITNPYKSDIINICADGRLTVVYQNETKSIKFDKLNYITYRNINTFIPLKIVSLQNHTIVKQEGFTEDLGFKKEDGSNFENYMFDEFIKDDSCIKRCIYYSPNTISKLHFSDGDILDIPAVLKSRTRIILFETYKTQTTKYIRTCSNTGKSMYYYMYRLDLGGQTLFEDEYIIDNNNNAVEDIYIKPAVSYDKIDSAKIKDFSLKSSTDPSITIEDKDGEKYIKIPKNTSSTIILTINYYYYGTDTTEDKEFTIFNN